MNHLEESHRSNTMKDSSMNLVEDPNVKINESYGRTACET